MTETEQAIFDAIQANRQALVDRNIALRTALDAAIAILEKGLAEGKPDLIKATIELLERARDG